MSLLNVVLSELDESWKLKLAFQELFDIFFGAEYVTAKARKEIEDGYYGCMFVGSIDVIWRLKSAAVNFSQ